VWVEGEACLQIAITNVPWHAFHVYVKTMLCVYIYTFINKLYVLGSTCIALWLLLGMSSSHIRLIYGKLSPSCYLFNARRSWGPCLGLSKPLVYNPIVCKSHHQSRFLIGLWSLMYIQNNLLQRERGVGWYMTTTERHMLVFFLFQYE
jgi:hypothetical protein